MADFQMCTSCGERVAATLLGYTLCEVCAGLVPDPDEEQQDEEQDG